jgi:signal transduction histidine kinase
MSVDKQNHIQQQLNERVKELECLYEIAKLNTSFQQKPLNILLEDALLIIKNAWQFPKIAEVCICIDHKKYETENYHQAIVFQEEDIKLNDDIRGQIIVGYSEEVKDFDEGPFLKEERSLLRKLASEISIMLERIEINEENKKLEHKLRHADRLATLGELIAGLAHEINEPLGNIIGFAELIKDDHTEDEQLQSDISKILTSSLHAREVIRKLMLFSKYDEKEVSDININDIIQKELYVLENRCKKLNIQIIKLLQPELPKIKANLVQLHQVLVNLIVNAIHAMPNGGDLILQTTSENDYLHIIVQDNGVGIAENHIQNIFDPFFTTKESDTNTGLGLSIVHGIIKSYNGQIEVESHIGSGTRFGIYLPINK